MEVKSKSLRLPPDLYYQIQKRAFEAGVSVEEILRMVFGEEYQTQEPDEQQLQAWQEDLDTLVAEEEELKSEPIGTVSSPTSEPIGTVTPGDVLASEPLTEDNQDEALTKEDYSQPEQVTNAQTPVPHQNRGSSDTQKHPASGDRPLSMEGRSSSTSVLTEGGSKASEEQGQPSTKKPRKSFLSFKGSGKKRPKRGFGR